MIDAQKRLQVTRMILTCLVVYFINRYYDTPQRGWTLVSVLFVMFDFTTVTEVYSKALKRFMGTALSAVYGILIIYCCADNIMINLIGFVLGMFFYAYYFMDQENSYVALIGMVTLTIVLLNPHEIKFAILRTFNISIGIFFSMLMMRFFYPQYAKDHMFIKQALLIEQLTAIIKNCLDTTQSARTIKRDFIAQEQKVYAIAADLRKYLNITQQEIPHMPQYIALHQDVFYHSIDLLRLLSTFIFCTTFDNIRLTPTAQSSLTTLYTKLQHVHNKLQQSILTTHDSNSAESIVDTGMIDKMFVDMSCEMDAMDHKIQTLLMMQRQWRSV